MVINDKMLEESIPIWAKMVNQLTSNQAVRAFMSVALIVIMAYQVIAQGAVSETVLVLLSSLIGYYFGENAPVPPRVKTNGGD